MKLRYSVLLLGLSLIVVGLVSCRPGGEAAPTAAAVAYTDPFSYCSAVGTIDAPGDTYTGPALPEAVVQGLQKALNTPEAPSSALESGSHWRCMDGDVYACFVGANLPCEAKANTSRIPTQEEVAFCQSNPESEFIPAAVTGRETVFEWRCRGGAPEIIRQVFQADEQGYLAEFWYQIRPATEASPGIPNPASQFCEEQGYGWEVRDEAGGQVGYCLFPDGSECEEWAYFRGDCGPGAKPETEAGRIIQAGTTIRPIVLRTNPSQPVR